MKRNLLFLLTFIMSGVFAYAQPPAPANVMVTTDPTAMTATVTWVDVADPSNTAEDGYVVVIKDGTGTTIDSTAIAANSTSRTTSALTPGNYTAQVRAFSGTAAPYSFDSPPAAAVPFIVQAFTLNPHTLSVDLGQVTNNLAVVQWDNTTSINADGFKLLVTNRATNTTQTINLLFGQSVHTVGGLMGGTDYSAQIQAFKGTVDGPLSNTVFWTTNPDRPSPPTVTITKDCPFEVIGEVTSPDPNRVQTYIIQKSFDGSSWQLLATNNVSNRFFSDREEDEIRGRTVFYRAFAENVTGLSTPSAPVAVQVKDYVKPPAPQNLTAVASQIGPDKITFSWTDPQNIDNVCRTNLIGSVNWRYRVNGGDPVTASDFPGTQSVTIDGLSMRDTVTIEVWYLNDRATLLSDIVSATARTLGPPDAPTIDAVIGFVDALGFSNVNIVSTDNSDDEDGFEYFIGLTPNVEEMVSVGKTKFATGIGSSILFTQKPVQEGVTYYYAVRGFNYLGNGPFSNVASGIMDYSKVPGVPFALAATKTDDGAKVTWSDNLFVEEYFVIEKSTDGGVTFDSIGIAGKNEKMFVDASVSDGDVVYYRVRAVNPVGSGAPSKPVMLALVAVADDPAGDTQGMVVFPNPTADEVRLTVAKDLVGQDALLRIVDQNFREVFREKLILNESMSIDLSTYPAGMYNVILGTEMKKISKKVQRF